MVGAPTPQEHRIGAARRRGHRRPAVTPVVHPDPGPRSVAGCDARCVAPRRSLRPSLCCSPFACGRTSGKRVRHGLIAALQHRLGAGGGPGALVELLQSLSSRRRRCSTCAQMPRALRWAWPCWRSWSVRDCRSPVHRRQLWLAAGRAGSHRGGVRFWQPVQTARAYVAQEQKLPAADGV